MSKYSLHAIILEGCPHSMAADNLLNNLKSNKEITLITHENKEKYKTDEINTFPQIYLKKESNNSSLLLGGNSDIQQIFKLFYKKKYEPEKVNKYLEENLQLNKRSLLNLIKIINS